ncbi:GmrSD restriction endonuclease domain-containing protein [Acinetobacter gyllenbergii]|uniref:GmrSD restriction endonuclease domain-containing protein n=1 Tax=Acinetobacter gyllenbergii TaxID=134534 RepID=UPI0003BFC27F|nr:DUF262 domain-containing protein [Acinetobacter gyllenbergii]ESK43138.1 hypothetical protein F987_02019 [Acinetobacter gyllenbergii NIPH 230]
MAKLTLWKALEQYHIVIPTIQRDYAQGRKNDPKITQIRKAFLQALVQSLTENQELELDFVYGALNQKTLELLDGQQRLTTLFLLHCYLVNKNKVNINEIDLIKEQLQKFSYQTRTSSKLFISQLVERLVEMEWIGKPSVAIENEAWFLAVWRKDPTIISILTMLDELDSLLGSKTADELEKLWVSLSSHSVLNFYLLPMNEFSLTDELYIKMNARGVQLTEFENFKAWLQGFLENKIDTSKANAFFQSIDSEWTDLIWTASNNKDWNKSFDVSFIHLFKICLLCEYRAYLSKNQKSDYTDEKDSDSLVSRLRLNLFISQNEYTDLFSNDVNNTIDNLTALLDFAVVKQQSQKNILEILSKDKPSYEEQANLATTYYFTKYIQNIDQFEDWNRISGCLVKNAKGYYNSEKLMFSVLEAIEQLAIYIGHENVLQKISTLHQQQDIIEFCSKTAFEKSHIEHEVEKTQLILQDTAWKELLNKYEEHEYFYGRVDFLLDYAKTDDQIICMDKFTYYAETAKKIFDDEFIKDKKYRLHQSLLSLGNSLNNYFVKRGRNLSFCSATYNSYRDRAENWRAVFDHNKVSDNNKSPQLKILLDMLEGDVSFEKLNAIRNQNLAQIYDWRKYFVLDANIFKYCSGAQIRKESEDLIFLLKKSKLSGTHAELRSYVLYHTLQTAEYGLTETDLDYLSVSSREIMPSLKVQNRLRITFKNGVFVNEIIEQNLEDGEFFRLITSEEMYEFKNIIKAQQQVLDEIKHPEREEIA